MKHTFKFILCLGLMVEGHTMIKALNTAATGMASQEANVNTISNNIANANTLGYKKQRTEFEDLMYETIEEAGASSGENSKYNVGTQIGSGSKVSATRRIHTSGSPLITNNPYDLMVQGEGFFGIVKANNEVEFTRDGSFNVDYQGNLVTRKGHRVFPGIQLPAGTISVNIAENGKVEAYQKGETQPQEVGTIPVFTFINPVGLKASGGNLYRQTVSSGEPIQNIPGTSNAGPIIQGSLETSNVSIMNEMTSLIKAQRAYEMNSKVMGVADQMLQTVNNIR